MLKVERSRVRASWSIVVRKNPPSEPKFEITPTGVNLASRISALRLELAALEQQQRQELVAAIAIVVGQGDVFTAAGLWSQPELQTQFIDADIRSVHALGLWLRQSGFDRVCRDGGGIVWSVGTGNLHDGTGVLLDDEM